MSKSILYFVFFNTILLQGSDTLKRSPDTSSASNHNLAVFTPTKSMLASNKNNDLNQASFNSSKPFINIPEENDNDQKSKNSSLFVTITLIDKVKKRHSRCFNPSNEQEKTLSQRSQSQSHENNKYRLSANLLNVSGSDSDSEDPAEKSKRFLKETRAQVRRLSNNSKEDEKEDEKNTNNDSGILPKPQSFQFPLQEQTAIKK